eukprot:PhF_6_TR2316/c0_g1_i2/m.4088
MSTVRVPWQSYPFTSVVQYPHIRASILLTQLTTLPFDVINASITLYGCDLSTNPFQYYIPIPNAINPLLDVLECSSIVRSTTTGHVCIRYVEYTNRESSSTSSCRSQHMLYKHRPNTLGFWKGDNWETFKFIENVGYCVPLFDQKLKRRVHESIVRDYTPKMIATAE